MRVLVTGATGFIGRALIERLARDQAMQVRAALRRPAVLSSRVESVQTGELSGGAQFDEAVRGCAAIVHTAARVHVMRDQAGDPLAEFRRVNVDATLRLARQAAVAGVRRFVFLSSVKVNGEQTAAGTVFGADDVPDPQDDYARSKHEAELGLRRIASDTGMEVVIVRPPLVYGPGVKANFARLLQAVARGLPLPLGAVADNRRSLIALDNLIDFLQVCLMHPAAANQTFVVCDGDDVSTAELVRRIAQALGCSARLLPVPVAVLRAAAAALGRRAAVERLCGDLQLDRDKTRRLLGWQPPIGLDEGLRRTVAGSGPSKSC